MHRIYQMKHAFSVLSSLGLWTLFLFSSEIQGKGLGEVSKQNPSTQPPPQAVEASGVPQPSSALAQGLVGQLFLSTSTSFVSVSKSSGTWKSGGGMSDVLVGYKFPDMIAGISNFGTFRYSPVSVSGREKEKEYRGVWETYYFGVRAQDSIANNMVGFGSIEAGYSLIYLQPLDGSVQNVKAEENGVSLALGGGVDYSILENRLAVGPRIHLGFGSTSIYQIGASAGFYF